MEKYDEAIEIFQSLKNLSFDDYCRMGTALYKVEKYVESKNGS